MDAIAKLRLELTILRFGNFYIANMKIVPYNPKYSKDFAEMNLAWISSMFKVEPEDEANFQVSRPPSRQVRKSFSPLTTATT